MSVFDLAFWVSVISGLITVTGFFALSRMMVKKYGAGNLVKSTAVEAIKKLTVNEFQVAIIFSNMVTKCLPIFVISTSVWVFNYIFSLF